VASAAIVLRLAVISPLGTTTIPTAGARVKDSMLRAISPDRIDWASPGMLVAYQITS